jgi:hypothetical protein
VVAAGEEVAGQPVEDAAAVVRDERRLPVHEVARLADGAAEELDERLVSEADAESWDPAAQAVENVDRRACVLGPAGSR